MPRRERWIVLALAAVLFLPCLGARDVWNPDEARYAQVAREMATQEGGARWLLPRLNGERYGEKPPLFFWAVRAAAWIPTGVQDVASGSVGRIDELAVRLPSALGAAGCLLVILSLGYRLFGRTAAWIAVAAFATCFKVLWQGRFGQIDMLLTFWVTLQMACFVQGHQAENPRLRPWFYRGFFVVGAVATATKGPAGFLPPLLAVVTFLLGSGEPRELRNFRPGRGLLLWAGVLLLWLLPAALVGGWEYVEQLVWRQSVTRYADPWHHYQPWWYYLTVIPVEFLPWSIFLPATGLVAYRRLRRGMNADERRGWLLALCWVVVTLVFFSLSPAKRSVYVLTLYPGLALLVGAALASYGRRHEASDTSRHERRWLLWPLAGWELATSAGLAAVVLLGPDRPELDLFGRGLLLGTLAAVALLTALSWASWRQAWRGRLHRAVALLAAAMGIFWLIVVCALLPRLDATKSARGLAVELQAQLQPDEAWTIFPRLDAGFLFYGDVPPAHRLEGEGDSRTEIDSLRTFLTRTDRVWVLARRDRLGALDDLPPLWRVAEDRDRRKGYLLLTNHPRLGAQSYPRSPTGPQ